MAQILNAMPDASGRRDHQRRQVRAHRERKAYRAGHYERKLTAKVGRLELKVPKLKGTLLIERYRRRMVHFMRNVLSKTPPTHREWASAAT